MGERGYGTGWGQTSKTGKSQNIDNQPNVFVPDADTLKRWYDQGKGSTTVNITESIPINVHEKGQVSRRYSVPPGYETVMLNKGHLIEAGIWGLGTHDLKMTVPRDLAHILIRLDDIEKQIQHISKRMDDLETTLFLS